MLPRRERTGGDAQIVIQLSVPGWETAVKWMQLSVDKRVVVLQLAA